jgi:peroxiredoxin
MKKDEQASPKDQETRPAGPKAGDQAPGFSVKDHNGRLTNLVDFRGKTVVLWFFPRADTPG